MIEKRSDAPLYHESKAMQSKAIGERVTGDWAKCEEYMEEALRMIRKTDGEYPTEGVYLRVKKVAQRENNPL